MGILKIKKSGAQGGAFGVAPCINTAFFLLFFALLLSLSAHAVEEDRSAPTPVYEEATPSEGEVSKKEVDDSAFVVPPPKIQIPVFEKGKWKGYRDEPADQWDPRVARGVASDPQATTGETISPVRRPSGQSSSVN